MDSFTQDMVQRARQRREMLMKKMADTTGVSPQRKRSAPLSELQTDAAPASPAPSSTSTDDSPNKRQCLRAEETEMKPDTPAIPGVRSRLQKLVTMRSTWDQENEVAVEPEIIPSPHRAPDPALDATPGGSPKKVSVGLKSRLAALAHNINSYEDDIPSHKSEEKGGQFCSPSPAKPPRTFEYDEVPESKTEVCQLTTDVTPSSKCVESSEALTDDPVTYSPSPVKTVPVNRSPVKSVPVNRSPVKSVPVNQSPVKSVPVNRSPVKSVSVIQSPVKSAPIGKSPAKSVPVNQSPAKSTPVAKTCQSKAIAKVQAQNQKSPRKSDAAEPTKKPVSARLAAWQERVNEVDKQESAIEKVPKPGAAWQQLTGRHQAPVKPPSPESPTKISPMKTPVAAATKTLHSKLEKKQEEWKAAEINTKAQQERKAELDALNNRWKNGIVNEHKEEPSTEPVVPQTSTPAAKTPAAKTPLTRSTKKNANRDKLRSEEKEADNMTDVVSEETSNFENKLKSIGFEINSVSDIGHVATLDLTPQRQKDAAKKQLQKQASSPVKTTSPTKPKKEITKSISHTPNATSTKVVTSTMPQATPTGRSLYSLIRGQAAPPTTHTPTVASRAQPAPTNHTPRCQPVSDDSFEEDVSTIQPPSKPVMKLVNRVSAESLQSVASTEGSYISQEDSVTQDDGSVTQDDSSVTQDDSSVTQDDYEATEEYSSEDGEMSSDEDENTGEIDDLLDEAMDSVDEETEAGAAAMTTTQPSPVKQVQHTPVQPVPERRVHWPASPQTSSSSTDGDKTPIVYSVSQYRRQNYEKRKSGTDAPKIVVVPQKVSPAKTTHPVPAARTVDVKGKLKAIQELVNQEQSIIMQTSNALNQCCGSNSSFAGSLEAVECHRLLLMACRRREAYLTEMTYLREGRSVCQQPGPRGSLTISDLRLPLKQDFINSIGTPRDTSVHYFVVMLRYGGKALFSQMVSSHDALVRGSLHLPNLMKFSDITQDFRVELEVYGMSVIREPLNTPKKKKTMTPKKPSKKLTMASPGGPLAVRTTNFTLLASQGLTMRCVDNTHFVLDRVPSSSPLQGAVHLKLQCFMEADVEHRGFTTMFEDVSGFGAWHRRWCVVKNSFLSYWKYPDDEGTKEPIGFIDLRLCVTDEVGLIARDICARPNSFELRTVRRQHRGERDTLISKCSNTMTTTKHWLSADTKEERIAWCRSLNEALRNLRAWNPDALRPIRPSKSTNPHPTESSM